MIRLVANDLKLSLRFQVLLVTLVVGCVSAPSIAGSSIQFLGGYSKTEESDLDVELLYIVPPVTGSDKVDGDSASFGFRYLRTEASLSLGIDFSHFDAASDAVEIDTWPLTYFLIYTFKGRIIDPYVGIGYSLIYVEMNVSADSDLGIAIKKDILEHGLAFIIGMSVPVRDQFSLFLEYRRDQTEIDLEEESLPIFFPSQATARYKTDLDTNRLLLGFSYNF